MLEEVYLKYGSLVGTPGTYDPLALRDQTVSNEETKDEGVTNIDYFLIDATSAEFTNLVFTLPKQMDIFIKK